MTVHSIYYDAAKPGKRNRILVGGLKGFQGLLRTYDVTTITKYNDCNGGKFDLHIPVLYFYIMDAITCGKKNKKNVHFLTDPGEGFNP